MIDKKTISLSKVTKTIIITLGQMIKSARLEKEISQQNLADRLNVSRYTIIAIEKGDPKVAIGAFFEAAYIVGIPLLGDNLNELKNIKINLSNLASILPKRAGKKKEDLNDDF